MRLCLEIKKQRGKPLRLVAAFLRAWYSDRSLRDELDRTSGIAASQDRCVAYIEKALQKDDALRQVLVQNIMQDFDSQFECGRYEDAMTTAEELAVADPLSASIRKCQVLDTQGQFAKALDEINRAISAPGLTPNQKAGALAYRGCIYAQIGEPEKALADLSTFLDTEKAAVEPRAAALVLRGHLYWTSGQFKLALIDFTAASKMSGVSSSIRTLALFSVPVATIPMKPLPESVASIQRAFAEGNPGTNSYGGSPFQILSVILYREHQAWPEYIAALVPIYAEYKALDALGSGLTQSIVALDAGGYSESQLDIWNTSWQKCGAGYDELSIGLSVLNAAVQVMKTGKDRPLFDLPSEIRKIVRPLLKNTLAK